MATQRDWGRPLLLGGGLLGAAASLFVAGGPLGVVVAVVAVGVAAVTRGSYGVGVAHLGALALVDGLTVVGLVLLEMGSAFLLVQEFPPGHRFETGALAIPVVVVLAVGVATLAASRSLLTVAVVLCLVVGSGSYLLHRYGRVRLGLAAGEGDA